MLVLKCSPKSSSARVLMASSLDRHLFALEGGLPRLKWRQYSFGWLDLIDFTVWSGRFDIAHCKSSSRLCFSPDVSLRRPHRALVPSC